MLWYRRGLWCHHYLLMRGHEVLIYSRRRRWYRYLNENF
jgi:hypothetical protein